MPRIRGGCRFPRSFLPCSPWPCLPPQDVLCPESLSGKRPGGFEDSLPWDSHELRCGYHLDQLAVRLLVTSARAAPTRVGRRESQPQAEEQLLTSEEMEA